MSIFKTAEEKRIEYEMQRDEQIQIFNEQIETLKLKRDEYALIAVEAEENNEDEIYNTCVNNLVELNEIISSLTQTKVNFDIINLSNSIATNMAMAVNALSNMAEGKNKLPNLRQIQKVNIKVSKYMRQIKVSNKAMANMVKNTNPSNYTHSQAQLDSVKPLLKKAKEKKHCNTRINRDLPTFDLAKEIEAESNK